MMFILQSLGRTITAGLFLLIGILLLVSYKYGTAVSFEHYWFALLFRYLHVATGVMWIGLLWYFNFVQMPSMSKIPDTQKPAISQVIAPAALFWFRHAALLTVITGVLLSSMNGSLLNALSLQKGWHSIGIGMWLAIVMAYNVWFIIWPNQKRALGIVSCSPEEKANSARMAMLTSRFNTMLSIPMLYCMVAQQNGGL